jgi:hypothetical protein
LVYRERGRVVSAQISYTMTLWHEMFAPAKIQIVFGNLTLLGNGNGYAT